MAVGLLLASLHALPPPSPAVPPLPSHIPPHPLQPRLLKHLGRLHLHPTPFDNPQDLSDRHPHRIHPHHLFRIKLNLNDRRCPRLNRQRLLNLAVGIRIPLTNDPR